MNYSNLANAFNKNYITRSNINRFHTVELTLMAYKNCDRVVHDMKFSGKFQNSQLHEKIGKQSNIES